MWWIISIGLFIGWGYLLLRLTQSKTKYGNFYFYLLLFAPMILPLFFTLITGGMVTIATSNIVSFILLIATIIYFAGWSMTLYEAGGNEKLVWFWLILIINPLWIIYRITQ